MIDNDQDLAQFVKTCARAFGAMINMRDDPLDAPFPSKVEPSSYHQEATKKAEERLAEMLKMNKSQARDWGQKEKESSLDYLQTERLKRDAEADKVRAMIVKVEGWSPPSKDHEPLKRFMLEQLKQSLPSIPDYYDDEIKRLTDSSTLSLYNDKVASLKKSIEYHKREYQKDLANAAMATEWIRAIVESLK